jgi:ribosome-binding protein aMBF1 (putative translation factor)
MGDLCVKSVDESSASGRIHRMARQQDVKLLFGRRLRQVRLARRMSQEKLADRASLDRSYVGSVERGERNISLENICKLAAALGCASSALLDFSAR